MLFDKPFDLLFFMQPILTYGFHFMLIQKRSLSWQYCTSYILLFTFINCLLWIFYSLLNLLSVPGWIIWIFILYFILLFRHYFYTQFLIKKNLIQIHNVHSFLPYEILGLSPFFIYSQYPSPNFINNIIITLISILICVTLLMITYCFYLLKYPTIKKKLPTSSHIILITLVYYLIVINL